MLSEPYWNGPLRGGNEIGSSCPTITANRISIANIEELLVKQYNHDFNEKSTEEKPEMSREDLKFMKIMNSSKQQTLLLEITFQRG